MINAMRSILHDGIRCSLWYLGNWETIRSGRNLIVIFEAHRAHNIIQGVDRRYCQDNILTKANQNHDYWFFEVLLYDGKPAPPISKGNMYLIQQRFHYVLQHSHGLGSGVRREVKDYVLYDIEVQFRSSYYNHCFEARFLCNVFTPNAYHIFDRTYNSFNELYNSFFVAGARRI